MASVTLNPATPLKRQLTTITGSGFSASTSYVLTITDPGGGTSHPVVKSDGAGAFTYPWVVTEPGTFTVDVRPLTEHTGTTSATATVTATCNLR